MRKHVWIYWEISKIILRRKPGIITGGISGGIPTGIAWGIPYEIPETSTAWIYAENPTEIIEAIPARIHGEMSEEFLKETHKEVVKKYR